MKDQKGHGGKPSTRPVTPCGVGADSGKHANSFSYACEKVQEASYTRKGEGFGERGNEKGIRG